MVNLKTAVLNLHQHLQQEQQDLDKEKEILPVEASEEDAVAEKDVSERKVSLIFVNAGPTFHEL